MTTVERRAMSASSGSGSVRAPSWPVASAALAAAVSVALAALNITASPASVPALITGYVLGAIVAVFFATTYRNSKNAVRRHPRFRVQPTMDRAVLVTMGVGFIAGMANAVLLATELAK